VVMSNKTKIIVISLSLFLSTQAFSAPRFTPANPLADNQYEIDGPALCATAKQTLDYLNRGTNYDPQVIHSGKVLPIKLSRIKATLQFICSHQAKLNDPVFIQQHFDFIRWQPDVGQAKRFFNEQTSVEKFATRSHLNDKILRTFSQSIHGPQRRHAIPHLRPTQRRTSLNA